MNSWRRDGSRASHPGKRRSAPLTIRVPCARGVAEGGARMRRDWNRRSTWRRLASLPEPRKRSSFPVRQGGVRVPPALTSNFRLDIWIPMRYRDSMKSGRPFPPDRGERPMTNLPNLRRDVRRFLCIRAPDPLEVPYRKAAGFRPDRISADELAYREVSLVGSGGLTTGWQVYRTTIFGVRKPISPAYDRYEDAVKFVELAKSADAKAA